MMNNSENISLCNKYVPTFTEQINEVDKQWMIISILISNVLTLILFLQTLVWILKNTPKAYVTKSVLLCSPYFICNLMTLSISLVPRAFFFCDTISHITFVICAYQMFNLFLRYVDGESKLIEFHQEKPKKFNVATPPCCCLLRLCFKKLPITKGRIDLTRILILQLTISHILLYIVLNIILINDVTTFNSIILYATPFIVGPILLGVWGLNIMLRMFDEAAPDYKLKGKYFALQLVLIFCKLLPAVEKVLSSLWLQNRICNEVTAPPTYLLLIISVLLLILQIWASRLYRYPIRI